METGSTSSRLAALEAKMQQMEEYVGQPPEGMRMVLCEQVHLLKQIVEDLKKVVDGLPEFVERKINSVSQDVEVLTDAVDMKVEAITTDVRLLKRAVGSEKADERASSSKVKIPGPTPFGGERSAKELENFLWDMETYFRATKVVEAEKVSIASMFLTGDAKLWWRTRLSEDGSAGRAGIDSWEALKMELKNQFLPCNTSWVARESLRNLRHSGTLREYVQNFSSLLLDIRDMSEEDKLFNFMVGLQPWAQAELRRQGVKDVQTAIAAADRLVDYSVLRNPNHTDHGPNDVGPDKGKATGKKKLFRKQIETTNDEANSSKAVTLGKAKKSCFICEEEGHLMRFCPKRERLNAIMAELDNGDKTDDGQYRMGALRVVNDANPMVGSSSGLEPKLSRGN